MRSHLPNLFTGSFWVMILIVGLPVKNVMAQSETAKPPLEHNIQTFTNEEKQVFINQHQGYHFLFSGIETEDQHVLGVEGERRVTLSEGPISIRIIAADGDVLEYPVIVDGSAPVSSITLENAPIFENEHGEIYAGKNLQLNYHSTDNLSGIQEQYWAVNSGGYNPFRLENLSFQSSQSFLIYFYSVDRVGNVEEVKHIEFEVDVLGPTVNYSVKGPQNLSVVSPKATITLTANDDGAGVKQLFYWFDGEDSKAYSVPISLSTLKDGEHTLHVFAGDYVENVGDTLTYTFYLDRSTPLVTADINGTMFQQEATTYISPQSTILLSSEDNKSGVSTTHFQINQEPERTYTNPIRVPSKSGTYSITFYAVDVVGNQGDKQSLKVYVDNGRPNTNVRFQGYYSTIPNGYAISPQTLIELTAGDLESGVKEIRYRLNNESWKTYTHPISFEKANPVILTYYAVDNVGNREPEHQTEIVIRKQEDLSMNGEPERVATGSSRFMKVGEAIQGPDKQVYLWVSSSASDTSQKFMMSHSADRSNVFPIRMEPNKENFLRVAVEGEGAIYPVIIDGNPPASTLEAAGAQSFKTEDRVIFAPGVNLSLSAGDNITGVREIYASENGGRYQLYDKPLSGYFSEQKYTVRYYAVDETGNEEKENVYEFNVDATPPITTHKFLNNYSGSTLSLFTTIQLEAIDNMSGVDTTYIQLNENPPVKYSSEMELSELGNFQDVFNTIYYYSTDNVGNTEQQKQVNFKIDRVGPEVEITWQGASYASDEQVFIHPSTKMVLNARDSEMEIKNIWYQKNKEGEPIVYQEPVSFENETRVQLKFAALDVLGNQGETHENMIIVDANSPNTRFVISGQTLENGNTVILGKGAQIDFSAADDLSGIAQIRYGVNSEDLVPYTNSVQFRTSGNKIIRYQATDRVGNVEELKTLAVIYDQNPPIIDLSYSKEPQLQSAEIIQIDAETLISITSSDGESEVKSVEYKWDEEEFKAYFRPIKNSEIGAHTLAIRTIDVLGNQSTKTLEMEIVEE